MSIFKSGKKKKENNDISATPSCCCSAGAARENKNDYSEISINKISCIKVLGAGCKACHGMYENTKQAVKNIGLNIEVEYITDLQKIMEYGAMSMPVLVINEKVVSQGKVLKANDIEKLLDIK